MIGDQDTKLAGAQALTETKRSFAFGLLLICFFLSGTAGLIYQTAWSQQFALVFGSSEMAVATVLAAYMAGLMGGAAIAGRMVSRLRRAVRVYALLEVGIAISALSVPLAIGWAGRLQAAIFSEATLPGQDFSWPLTLFDLGTSFAILAIPTGLMGATLPILVRFAVRHDRQIAAKVGSLYATNTAGAALGTLATAFLLLPALGLGETILIGVALNGAAALFAFALAWRQDREGSSQPEAQNDAAKRPSFNWVLPAMMLSGAVAFAYEVLWTRLLPHVLGGSVYAFGTMLTVFLLGIALGAAAGRKVASSERARLAFGLIQIGIALSFLGAFFLADLLPSLAGVIGKAFPSPILVGAVVSGATLLPGAIFSGATYPIAVRLLTGHADDAARASAAVYAWNTVGAMAGAIGTGFFLIPMLGFAGTVRVAAMISLALAVAVLAGSARTRPNIPRLDGQLRSAGMGFARGGLFLSAAALVLLLFLSPPTPWTLLSNQMLSGKPAEGRPVFLGVGRAATVLLSEEGPDWRISTNGLPESIILAQGSRSNRMTIPYWLSMLPLAARPDAGSMLVIGLGAGVTVEDVPQSVNSIKVVELEPEVIHANRFMKDLRQVDPLADPRLSLHVNDARSALLLTEERFDAIVSQPSHPWTSGSAHLFTREFFQIVRERLSPGGVFSQWIGAAFVDEALLRSLVATLLDVFPNVEVYSPANRQAILFLASDEALVSKSSLADSLSKAQPQWSHLGVYRPEDFWVGLTLDTAACRVFAADAPLILDQRNLLQIRSPRILNRSFDSRRSDDVFPAGDPSQAKDQDLNMPAMVRHLLDYHQFKRARRLAAACRTTRERRICQGMIALAEKRPNQGVPLLGQALKLEPGQPEAEAALILHFRQRFINKQPPLALQQVLSARAETFIQGLVLEKEEDWAALSALDEALAIADPAHPLFDETRDLRVRWRLASGDRALAEEAWGMLETYPTTRTSPTSLILLARAAVATGRTQEVLASLWATAGFLERLGPQQAGRRAWLAQSQEILAGMNPPDSEKSQRLHTRLAAKLEALANGLQVIPAADLDAD